MRVRVLYWLGIALVAVTLVVLAFDLWVGWRHGVWKLSAGGEIWYRVSPGSLNALQAGIQRHVAPWLWDPFIQQLLIWPVVLTTGLPGLALLLYAWPRFRR